VAIAESLQVPLATLDGRLAKAAGPRCQFLARMPVRYSLLSPMTRRLLRLLSLLPGSVGRISAEDRAYAEIPVPQGCPDHPRKPEFP
jgi:hypothetical protein